MVQAAIIIETMPAQERSACSWPTMLGQAAPSSESGRPRLMKAR